MIKSVNDDRPIPILSVAKSNAVTGTLEILRRYSRITSCTSDGHFALNCGLGMACLTPTFGPVSMFCFETKLLENKERYAVTKMYSPGSF